MKKFTLIILSIIMMVKALAQLPGNLDPYIKRIEDKDISAKQIAIINAILANTNEVHIHQQNGAKDNVVFIAKDGHGEAVFDKQGQLVKDGVNDGSYNYFHPAKQPLQHFTADISPWIMWGQSREDNTSVRSRIYAYMGDLEGGIRKALELQTIPEVQIIDKIDFLALAVFFRAIEEGQAESLFQLFGAKNTVTDAMLMDVFTRLNKGLDIIYMTP